MRKQKKSPEEHAANVAYLRCFANCAVSVMELKPLFDTAKAAFLRGDNPEQAMIAYADLHGIEHNQVKEGTNA